MAVTVTWDTWLSDQEIEQQFDATTRFCLIHEPPNEPGGGTAYGYQAEILDRGFTFMDQMMTTYRNVQFLTKWWHPKMKDYDNVAFYPGGSFLFLQPQFPNRPLNLPIHYNKTVECMVSGGTKRINRILAGYWLAKHMPKEKLLSNWQEVSELHEVVEVINRSPYYKKSHIKHKRFLPTTFITKPAGTQGERIMHLFLNHQVPNYHNRSFVCMVPESVGVELGCILTEKTMAAFAGKNFLLSLGNYKVNELLKDLGFETFDHLLDNSHLDLQDRYGMTICGLENNKELMCDFDRLQTAYHENIQMIEHNYNLATKSNSLIYKYKKEIQLLREMKKYLIDDSGELACNDLACETFEGLWT